MESEISGVARGCLAGKVKRNENDTGNDEHDALHRRMYGDGEEDEIRSDDPSSDKGARIPQDHTRTGTKNGECNPLVAQTRCGIGRMGNAGVGDEERQLRLGGDSICLRWLAVVGLPKIGLESLRGALDETRIRGCDCEVSEQGTQVDCRLGRVEHGSRLVAQPEWWEIRTVQRRF